MGVGGTGVAHGTQWGSTGAQHLLVPTSLRAALLPISSPQPWRRERGGVPGRSIFRGTWRLLLEGKTARGLEGGFLLPSRLRGLAHQQHVVNSVFGFSPPATQRCWGGRRNIERQRAEREGSLSACLHGAF